MSMASGLLVVVPIIVRYLKGSFPRDKVECRKERNAS